MQIVGASFFLALVFQVAPAQDKREHARKIVVRDVEASWSLASRKKIIIEVVEVGTKEFERVFPEGLKHLPGVLQPRAIYPAYPGSEKRWQYLGTRNVDGFRFAIFRLIKVPKDEKVASIYESLKMAMDHVSQNHSLSSK